MTTERVNAPLFTVANVDGRKMCLMQGQFVLDRQQLTQRIAFVGQRLEQLAADKTALNAESLLARARANIDRQIEQLTRVKIEMEALVGQLDA